MSNEWQAPELSRVMMGCSSCGARWVQFLDAPPVRHDCPLFVPDLSLPYDWQARGEL